MKNKKVFVVGGYGYRNVGDEGQLNGNLNSFKNKGLEVVVATPDVSFSRSIHEADRFVEALRSCYFKQSSTRRFQISYRNKKSVLKFLGNELYKIRFALDSFILLLDCLFYKKGDKLRLVNIKTRNLVKDLASSDVLFFSGGGYLTEPTLSRLWDGFLHMAIARIFKVNVVLSGQTIGPINGYINKKIAKYLFSECSAISLRDGKKSVDCLNSIGVNADKYEVVCDDATFCHANAIKNDETYIAYQFHYWGATSEKIAGRILGRNIEIVNYLLSKGLKVRLVSMTPTDEEPLSQLFQKIADPNLELAEFKYDIGYVVGIFKNASLTITMKHHPIVFSIGQLTPVISLNFSEYYHHKNNGALNLFNLDRFGVDLFLDLTEIFDLIDMLLSEKASKRIITVLSEELLVKRGIRKGFFNRFLN